MKWYVENRSGLFYAGHGRWVKDPGFAHSFDTEREAIGLRDYFTPLMTRVVHM